MYANNFIQTPGSTADVTTNFVDTSLTVVRYMLNNPAVEEWLSNMDILCTLDGDRFQDLFDSHSRLQAILDKLKASGPSARVVWVCQGNAYNVRSGNIKSLSVADVKGTSANSYRGYADFFFWPSRRQGISCLIGQSRSLVTRQVIGSEASCPPRC